jgi:hypothetical protein
MMKFNMKDLEAHINRVYGDGTGQALSDLRRYVLEGKVELKKKLKGPPFDTEAFLFGTIKIKEILGEEATT